MKKNGKIALARQRRNVTRIRRGLLAVLILALFGSFVITRITTIARNDSLPAKPVYPRLAPSPKPADTPPAAPIREVSAAPTSTPEGLPGSLPPQISATRITIVFGEKYDLQVAAGADSLVVVSPEVASAEIKNRFTIGISALKIGETILLVGSGQRRRAYIVAVVARPAASERSRTIENGSRNRSASSGSSTTMFAQGSGGVAVIRQSVSYNRKLSGDRTLRVSGDMFKLLGTGNSDLAFARVENFGLNRLSVGLDTSNRSIDLLDSEINLSPLSLNNYTIRGFHLASKAKPGATSNLPEKGLEVFAGYARPSISFYDNENGKVAGVMVPVVNSSAFRVRAGVIAISPERNNRNARGGAIFQTDAAYAPTKNILADAEVAYANGDLSWRGRLDLRYTKFGASGEIIRLARSSPLNSIGAQPGGRNTEAFSLYWRPATRFSASGGYNHTKVSRLTNPGFLADFDRSLVFANASYTLNRNSRINLRYTDQNIETAFPGGLSRFKIETRSLLIGYNSRFNKNWSNTLEGRVNFSRESGADAGLEKGFSLNEQLRFAWRGGSVTGFATYNHKSPSLTSLIVRNPQLLPPALQAAFALDPAAFIRANRDRLNMLLNGIELPQTRSLDAGARIQKTFSRFTTTAEVRYNAGEVLAVNHKNLYIAASIGIRLDNANSLQVNGWRTMGGRSENGITLSYTHQLGSSGDGFQFLRLFNFNRGKISGRVFYDLNGNGRPDPTEPGVPGMKIQIDGKRNVTTDKNGRYELSANEGQHKVVLISSELGVRLLATTATNNIVALDSGQKLNLNFGVRDFGSISGRVFNDTDLSGTMPARNPIGLGGIRIIIKSVNVGYGSFTLKQETQGDGTYDFRDLRPGVYTIEIDPASLPANFNIPGITSSPINVEALHSTYYDVPLAAQRAVAGVVFIDRDGDGRYTVGNDEPVQGASVTIDNKSSISGVDGAYLLRNLPAGKTELIVRFGSGAENTSIIVELGAEPVTQQSIDIPITRY